MRVTNVHESAVEAAIASTRGLTPADEPLVQLARTLARQVDDAGPDGPGTRLASTYLTTVRTLMARLGPLVDLGPTTLAQLRGKRLREPARTARKRVAS